MLLKAVTGAKLVYDAHELESNRNGLSVGLGKLVLKLERSLWRYIDGLIVVSPSIEAWYHKMIGTKLSCIVMNAPMADQNNEDVHKHDIGYLRYRFSIPHDKQVFIYVGILGSGRGIELIVEAFKDERVDSHLVFLGYGEMAKGLQAISEDHVNIHLHPAVPHEDVIGIVSTADWGLCLVEDVSLSDFYCLPNKLFEYAFSGIQVLASNFPDITKTVDDYSLGVTTDLTKEALISALTSIQKNSSPYSFDRERLRPLSWEFQEQKLIEFYDQVLIIN